MISGTDLFLGLFNNLAIFIVLVAVYGSLNIYFEGSSPGLRAAGMGICFGLTAIVCMHVRIPVAEGVVVDQRNAIVALSGAFGGPIAACICAATAGAYRAYLGGAGVPGGIVGVSLAASAGMLLYFLRKRRKDLLTQALGAAAATLIILPGFAFYKDFATGFRLMVDMALPYGSAIFTGIFLAGLLLSREENRRAADLELKESEKRFRNLYEGLIDVSYRTDREGRIVHISPSCGRLFGYTPEKLIGQPIVEFYRYPEARDRFLALLMPNGRVESFEAEIRRHDGTFVWVSTNAKLLTEKNGDYAGVEGISRDLTRQKKAEEEKLLLEDSLRQSQKMEALGTLAGGIAHDFNNILGAILGYTTIVMESLPQGSRERKHLQSVISATGRAADLTRQILVFSRKGKPDKKIGRIHPIVEEAVRLLKKTIPSTVQIRVDINPDTGFVLADFTQVHQIVMNLCTNAYHALADENGEIRIMLWAGQVDRAGASVHPNLREGRYAVLCVEDTGRGIDPVDLPRIFEPFFTTKEKGTGLGLSVVHGIVADHDGAVLVESEPSRGTRFRVFLPLVTGAEADETNQEVQPRSGTERILLVDDEAMLVELWKTVLEGLGYRVAANNSVKEALDLFLASPDDFDLIVTDQTMPEMSGDSFAREIMRIRPEIPVILCTGHSEVIDEQKALAIGVRAFLMKPLSAQQLVEAVRRALDEPVQRASTA